jgi:hypothetical protein
MLGEESVDDLLAISLNADKLWSIHNHQQHGVVASLSSISETPAATVAAVKQSFPANVAAAVAREPLTVVLATLPLSTLRQQTIQPAPVLSGKAVCWPLLLPLVFW